MLSFRRETLFKNIHGNIFLVLSPIMKNEDLATAVTAALPLPCKAVIFDMDGTLLATTEIDFLAWQQLFLDFGKQLSLEDYKPLLGIKSAEVLQTLFGLSGEALQEALYKRLVYIEEVVNRIGVQPIPFADNFLKSLSQYEIKIALATSSRKAKVELVMQAVGLQHYFDVMVTGEAVKNGKPAPDIFIQTAQQLNVHPADCVVFEDAVTGILSAKSAGMKCVAITTNYSEKELQDADLVINSFENLQLTQICNTLYK